MSFLQALAKDVPWKLKDSRVLEILEAVRHPHHPFPFSFSLLLMKGKKPPIFCFLYASLVGRSGSFPDHSFSLRALLPLLHPRRCESHINLIFVFWMYGLECGCLFV